MFFPQRSRYFYFLLSISAYENDLDITIGCLAISFQSLANRCFQDHSHRAGMIAPSPVQSKAIHRTASVVENSSDFHSLLPWLWALQLLAHPLQAPQVTKALAH